MTVEFKFDVGDRVLVRAERTRDLGCQSDACALGRAYACWVAEHHKKVVEVHEWEAMVTRISFEKPPFFRDRDARRYMVTPGPPWEPDKTNYVWTENELSKA